jgi:tetratricopeptide (TPR) repeat protein
VINRAHFSCDKTNLVYIGALSRDNEDRFFVDFGIMPQESNSEKNFSDLFTAALALQQEKKWDEALTSYGQLLDQSLPQLSAKQAASIYHNMSAAAYAKSDFLKAYVWSKKAMALDPSNEQIQTSYANYAKKVEIPSIPHQISGFDQVKKSVTAVPFDIWIIVTLVVLLAAALKVLKHTVQIRKDRLNGNFKKPVWWVEYAIAAVAVVLAAGTFISYQESQIQHAVVVAEKAPVQTVPGENKPVILEAQAGLEVEVLAANDQYFQVRYPGAFTGWINRSQIELLSLSFRQ